MKSYINSIILLNEEEKRFVPLLPGVNIITGDSKTGKSALVEIIDYCLCSSHSTIPKGIITDFSKLFCITLVIENSCFVIARQNSTLGSKMYVQKEDEHFDPNLIDWCYFSDKKFSTPNEIKYQIEASLGLFTTNLQTDELDGKPGKATLRNMVSYMFQHQNLMASKFALFYRFNDFYKRKATIQQFPVFAGLVGQEYYSTLMRINELTAKMKQLEKKNDSNKQAKEKAKAAFTPLLETYFALLNLPFNPSLSFMEMIAIAKELPVFDDAQLFDNQNIYQLYEESKDKLQSLREEERCIMDQISNLTQANTAGDSFAQALEELRERTTLSMPTSDTVYTCPLCGNQCENITLLDQDIIESSNWLDSELAVTSKYTANFSEDIRKLSSLKDSVVAQIKETWLTIKTLEKNYINSSELATKKEQVDHAKLQISLYLELIEDGIFKSTTQDIQELKDEIALLKIKVENFDLKSALYKAQSFISDNMNRLAKTLDFEDEYKPITLNFELVSETFDIYHHQNHREKIFLYEMGSGANWVSSHIVLFLSLLRYFCKNPKAPMLPIMFFDQPSQVYFPNSVDLINSADLDAVNSMYQTIFDEIKSIEKDSGFSPQLIIVDHVTGKELSNQAEFRTYVRREWRNGQHLI